MASNNQGNQGEKKSGSSNRGFASMDPQRQRQIASEGGKAAHEKGTAHEFTPEEARRAGRKGGEASGGGRGAARGAPTEPAGTTDAAAGAAKGGGSQAGGGGDDDR